MYLTPTDLQITYADNGRHAKRADGRILVPAKSMAAAMSDVAPVVGAAIAAAPSTHGDRVAILNRQAVRDRCGGRWAVLPSPKREPSTRSRSASCVIGETCAVPCIGRNVSARVNRRHRVSRGTPGGRGRSCSRTDRLHGHDATGHTHADAADCRASRDRDASAVDDAAGDPTGTDANRASEAAYCPVRPADRLRDQHRRSGAHAETNAGRRSDNHAA